MEWQRLVCPSVPPSLSDITLQLRAPPCHTKQSGMDGCTRPLSSSLNSSYKCQCGFFFFCCFCQVLWTRIEVRCEKNPCSLSVFTGSGVCPPDSVSHSLETPSPPAAQRSLWRRRLRCQTFWKRWRRAGRFAPLTLQSSPVSSTLQTEFSFSF